MKIKDIVNRDLVNLQNCDQEPIHIPGSIQPHGFLLAADRHTLKTKFCSGNALEYTGISYQQMLDKPLASVLGDEAAAKSLECLHLPAGESKSFHVNFFGTRLECVAHANEDYLVIEAERPADLEPKYDMFELSKQFLGYMEDTHTLSQLCALVT